MDVKSTASSSPGPQPAAAIAEERARTNFNVSDMYQFLEGNPKKANLILRLYKSLERDPILQGQIQHYDNDKLADREWVARRIDRLTQYIETESPEVFFRRLNLITMYDPSLGVRISVNLGLFLNGIKGNGTAEQYNYWAKKREAFYMKQIYGCFGMTELGHGSNVAGVETTATFDEETDEFIIDTPHIGATKWWIGGAAHSLTHSVVYARLIVKGKDYGVKTFVVPLRDSRHRLHSGVSIGDIGAKMGRQGIDNGWIQFTDVRIPRFFMLQRWCKVSRTGEVTLPPLEQLSYISLLEGRVNMALDSYRAGARFTTIALRYAIGRRQFKTDDLDENENKLLDYGLHQRRLLPYLALVYAMGVGTDRLEIQHETVVKNLDKALESNDKRAIGEAILGTKSLFVDSGSMKSSLTWLANSLIDETRQSCGGHGYSLYNGFGKATSDWSVQMTWEGDNNVLAMSAGKTIIKNVEQIVKKNKLVEPKSTLAFLNNAKSLENDLVLRSAADLEDPHKVQKALEVMITKYAVSVLDILKKNGGNWDLVSVQRVELSKLRTLHYMLQAFVAKVDNEVGQNAAIRPHLLNVLQLFYAFSILNTYASDFIRFNIIDVDLAKYVNYNYITDKLAAIRPYTVGLTDSFQIPDNLLNSLIGKYDGNIYENYFGAIKQMNPPSVTKAPYSLALEAMLNRPSLEDRDRGEKSEETEEILSK